MEMGIWRRKGWTVFGGVLLVLAMVLAGCSGSSNNADMSTSDQASDKNFTMASESNGGSAAMEAGSSGAADSPAEEAAGQGAGMDSLLGTAEDGFSRKVVYRGTVTLEAENFGKAQTELQNAIHQSKGYILSFQDIQSPYENGATYTIKVPAAGFMSFLDRIGQIAHTHYERQLSGTDVTEEYVDLESRLKAKQVVEARLLGFMEKATRADDLVNFSQQLANVQEEIERIKGRVRYLDQNVAYSTIELRLYQPLEPSASAKAKNKPLLTRMSDALGGSARTVLNGLQGLLVFAAGAVPVLLVLAIVAVPAVWVMRRREAAGRSRATAEQQVLRSRSEPAVLPGPGNASGDERGEAEPDGQDRKELPERQEEAREDGRSGKDD